MAKATWIKIDGSWKKVKNVWIKVDGVWKPKVKPKGKINGVWKEFISYFPEKVFYLSETGSGAGGWVNEIDGKGNFVTRKALGTNSLLGFDIDKDGNIYTKNYSSSSLTNTPISKYAPDYTLIWRGRHDNTESSEKLIFVDINGYVHYIMNNFYYRRTPDGTSAKIVATGVSNDILAIDRDGCAYYRGNTTNDIIKRDVDNDAVIWRYTVPTAPRQVVLDDKKNVYIVRNGSTNLMKLNSEGILVLNKTPKTAIYLGSLSIGKDESPIVTSSDGSKLMKLDSSFNVVWEKNETVDTFQAIGVDPDGNIYTTGIGGYRKYDRNGNLIFSKDDGFRNEQGNQLIRTLVRPMPGLVGSFPNEW